MAPYILILSIAMSADYSFYVKTIETRARAFLTLNILATGSKDLFRTMRLQVTQPL